MKWLVLLLALLMPLVGWLSNTGLPGPSSVEIPARYPTLIVIAGCAFAIWGPIFPLDGGFALGQALKLRGNPWYALAAVRGLLGMYARQQASALAGAGVAAVMVLSLAVLVVFITLIIGLSHWQPRQLESEP